MKLEEIEAKKAELKEKIANATADEIEQLKAEVEALNNEVPEQEQVDERKLVNNEIEKVELRPIEERTEKKMTNSKYNAETRAWAKKLLGRDDFDDEEKRALGDAVTTTATTFVASAGDTQGINNGGVFIPKEVRTELMEIIDEMSPFYRDIRKLAVQGNVDLPYLYAGDDANWYAELTDTVNEGNEYKSLQLTGWDLAKDVVLTWKVEAMSVDSFVTFVIEELAHKMGCALVNACIYGDGSSKPTGAIYNLDAITTGATPIDVIFNTLNSLATKDQRGAKIYVSPAVYNAIIGYKDENGNYPYLLGLPAISGTTIEKEDFLLNNDIMVGNPRYYILNEVSPVIVEWARELKGRVTRYGATGIYDGKPKPGAFAKGQFVNASI